MPTNSLLPALPYAADAVIVFREAAVGVTEGDLQRANDALSGLDDQLLRSHFDDAVSEWGRRNKLAATPWSSGIDKALRHAGRMPGVAGVREVFQRDGWRCRWCSTPVIWLGALKAMARRCPDGYRHGRRDDDRHGLTLCSAASLDHVLPHSFGGTNDLANLVTACWPCQFGRGNDLIDRLDISDPRTRKPIVDEWDGCASFR